MDSKALWSRTEAERIKENYAALLRQIGFERKSATVVTIDDAAMIVASEYAAVRNRLNRPADDLCAELADLTSTAEIKSKIDDAVIAALAELSCPSSDTI